MFDRMQLGPVTAPSSTSSCSLRHLLAALPFSALLTMIITLGVCYSQYSPPRSSTDGGLPQISQLGAAGAGHTTFAGGFTVLAIQITLLMGAWWHMIRTMQREAASASTSEYAQLSGKPLPAEWCTLSGLVNHLSLLVGCLALIFCLVMAFNSVDTHESTHLTGAYGTFALLVVYELLQVPLLLSLRSGDHPAVHGPFTLVCVAWACTCIVVGGICSAVWATSAEAVPEWIAALCPFLFFLVYVRFLYRFASHQSRMGNPRDEQALDQMQSPFQRE